MAGIGAVFGDLERTFRTRPAIVVGAAVLGLIGISLLNRDQATDEAPAGDPLAGLFPGVDTYGGAIPGSGSVPFPGYPSAGDGSVTTPPDPWILDPPPVFGLQCNGVLEPASLGIPGNWVCTDDGWKWKLPDGWPPPSTNPPPGAGGSTYLFAAWRAGKVRRYGWSTLSGARCSRKVDEFTTGGFSAEVRRLGSYRQCDGTGTRTIYEILSGSRRGWLVAREDMASLTTRTR